ncbi:MAG: enoyl-CoA hydratase-related protein [Planctomycetota bacterium]
MEILWIFFALVALQPALQRKLLEVTRQRLLSRIEKERGSRVILLVHRQETMGFLGFPMLRYIDVNDAEEVLRAIHLTPPDVPIDVVLHTPGGLVLPSLQIARALRRHRGRVTAFVPHYAMSGGTLIALAADSIVMAEDAVLGPVDPQIGEYPAASILDVMCRKPVAEIDDETIIRADQAEKALAQVRASVEALLAEHELAEKAKDLAAILTQGTWTHDHPISYDEARELGLAVRSDVPENVYTLMSHYPQPTRRQPGVEYSPGDRRPGGGGARA